MVKHQQPNASTKSLIGIRLAILSRVRSDRCRCQLKTAKEGSTDSYFKRLCIHGPGSIQDAHQFHSTTMTMHNKSASWLSMPSPARDAKRY